MDCCEAEPKTKMEAGVKNATKRAWYQTYAPVLLIFFYLMSVIIFLAVMKNDFSLSRLMSEFMGGFFLVFSFFKFLNWKGFADSYQSYDLLAKHSRGYAFLYPVLELVLGFAYLGIPHSRVVLLATVVLMGVSSLGVIQSLRKKQAIPCACLGTVFELPMSTLTLIEDFLMFGMAIFMLVR